jgi:hypothetical protein
MSTNKTPTPLTDAVEIDASDLSDWGTGPSGYVHTDFARDLERSNAALVEVLRELVKISDELESNVAILCDDNWVERGETAWAAARSALAAAKEQTK